MHKSAELIWRNGGTDKNGESCIKIGGTYWNIEVVGTGGVDRYPRRGTPGLIFDLGLKLLHKTTSHRFFLSTYDPVNGWKG